MWEVMSACECMSVCVCVCERERERERGGDYFLLDNKPEFIRSKIRK